MEAMLQRHCARYIYVIPDGLRELMSDISREVLRNQPTDIYTFIADYLDALIITRENARVAVRLVETLTELAATTASLLEETGMSREEVDHIVEAVQRIFKKSIDSEFERHVLGSAEEQDKHIVQDVLHEINIDPERAEVAAIIIQQAYHRFKDRKEREKELLAGLIDWRVAARSAIKLYRRTGVTNEEAKKAATLIKAAYKGYYTRKMMKKIAETESEVIRAVGIEDNIYDIEEPEEEFSEEKPAMKQKESIATEGDDATAVKTVKIDYNTVIPHVDFDTSGQKEKTSQQEIERNISTTSSIVRYSLGHIFKEALHKVSELSHIPINEEIKEVISAELDKEKSASKSSRDLESKATEVSGGVKAEVTLIKSEEIQ